MQDKNKITSLDFLARLDNGSQYVAHLPPLTPPQDSVSSPLLLLCLSEGGKKWVNNDIKMKNVWFSTCLVVALCLCQTTPPYYSEGSVHVLPLSCQTIHTSFTELSQWVSVLSPSLWWTISQFPHVNCNFFSKADREFIENRNSSDNAIYWFLPEHYDYCPLAKFSIAMWCT